MYLIHGMSVLEVGQCRWFQYHTDNGDCRTGLRQASRYCDNSRPYQFEYDRRVMFDRYFQTIDAPALTIQLRSVMTAHTPTATCVFRDTDGWETKTGWTDDYEEFATLMRRFEKAGLYNGLLPIRIGLTDAQWKDSVEGRDWTAEAVRLRQERWDVLAAADTRRSVVATQQQRTIAAKANRAKQKAYVQNFFGGCRDDSDTKTELKSDRVTLVSESQRDRERERGRDGRDREREREVKSSRSVAPGCSYPDPAVFRKRCQSSSTWIDAFYGSDWYGIDLVFFVKLCDQVPPVWLQAWQVHDLMGVRILGNQVDGTRFQEKASSNAR